MKEEKKLYNRHYYRKYDRIIMELNGDCKTSSDSGEHIADLRYLKNLGYIELIESPPHKITLTPEGYVLRSEGGLLEQDNIRKQLRFYKILSGILAVTTVLSFLKSLDVF